MSQDFALRSSPKNPLAGYYFHFLNKLGTQVISALISCKKSQILAFDFLHHSLSISTNLDNSIMYTAMDNGEQRTTWNLIDLLSLEYRQILVVKFYSRALESPGDLRIHITVQNALLKHLPYRLWVSSQNVWPNLALLLLLTNLSKNVFNNNFPHGENFTNSQLFLTWPETQNALACGPTRNCHSKMPLSFCSLKCLCFLFYQFYGAEPRYVKPRQGFWKRDEGWILPK